MSPEGPCHIVLAFLGLCHLHGRPCEARLGHLLHLVMRSRATCCEKQDGGHLLHLVMRSRATCCEKQDGTAGPVLASEHAASTLGCDVIVSA
jgi:hypothetical protein